MGQIPYPEKHPHTIMFPPPCLTVGVVYLGLSFSPRGLRTPNLPSDPSRLNLDLSDHSTFFYYCLFQFKYILANLMRAFLFFSETNGFLVHL